MENSEVMELHHKDIGLLEMNSLFHIKNKEDGVLATNLLTFTVPLLLVWMYDLLRFRRKRKEKK